jgi:hypothetical protein
MSGFLSVVGLAVMVVAVLRLFGRARWAHIASRRLASLVLAAGFGIGLACAALASSNTPNASAPAPSPAVSGPGTGDSIASAQPPGYNDSTSSAQPPGRRFTGGTGPGPDDLPAEADPVPKRHPSVAGKCCFAGQQAHPGRHLLRGNRGPGVYARMGRGTPQRA